jgi:hypothetical protein
MRMSTQGTGRELVWQKSKGKVQAKRFRLSKGWVLVSGHHPVMPPESLTL